MDSWTYREQVTTHGARASRFGTAGLGDSRNNTSRKRGGEGDLKEQMDRQMRETQIHNEGSESEDSNTVTGTVMRKRVRNLIVGQSQVTLTCRTAKDL